MKASHQPAAIAKRTRRPRLARRLLVLALGLGTGQALAQQVPLPPATTDSLRTVVDLPPASIDSLAAEPLVPAVDSARLLWLQVPATLYETVADRMGCLQSDMPLHYNEAVLAYVRLFTERQRGYTQRVLEREQFYFPTFEKYLAQYHLPIDLKYLSVVESALIPTAKSPVGAVGLWQFMPPTAGDLHLKRDEWVDERMHPEKATEAACKHLRYLYGLFHDWELVLAAYNWGAGNVHRVMRRTGKKTFWELYPHLPAETRNYVPTFTAVLYAMRYAPDYQLHNAALRYQRFEPLDTLSLTGQALDLHRLSRALGYDDSLALIRYNPEVRRAGLPAGYRPYVLRYPSAAREHLGDVDRATLLAYCQPVADLPRPLAARLVYPTGYVPLATNKLAAAPAETTVPRYRRLRYTVRKGQTLATIAERFEVSSSQLRRWNELSKHAPVRPGQQLVVLQSQPIALTSERTSPATTTIAAVPSPAIAVDSAAQALAAANLRYAREAQEVSRREAAQAQELLRHQRQQALRAIAQQRADASRLAAAAKVAAVAEKAHHLALAAAVSVENQTIPELAAAPHSDSSAQVLRRGHSHPVATSLVAAAGDNAQARTPGLPAPTMGREEAPPAGPAIKPGPAVASGIAGRSEARPTFYTVQPGDNLTKVAHETGATIAQLREWNQLFAKGNVQAGQRLRLRKISAAADRTRIFSKAAGTPPARLGTHTVQPGDTLFNISRRFGVSVQELRRLNHLKSDDVKLGQKLLVQAG